MPIGLNSPMGAPGMMNRPMGGQGYMNNPMTRPGAMNTPMAAPKAPTYLGQPRANPTPRTQQPTLAPGINLPRQAPAPQPRSVLVPEQRPRNAPFWTPQDRDLQNLERQLNPTPPPPGVVPEQSIPQGIRDRYLGYLPQKPRTNFDDMYAAYPYLRPRNRQASPLGGLFG